MNLAREPTSTDEYFVTAHQIFDCCGVESASTLRVDCLIDKFAPFVKTNMAEFSFLKTLLDPDECNPEINVTKLANALHQYSESQKTKMDLDESFNLRSGPVPQDSDSGISTDGLQLLEELQCELKEKERLAQQLRSQLDYTDRQHEDTTAALYAERDSLKRHLNILRDENASLAHVRRDYDEACERLSAGAAAADEAKRELEGLKRRMRVARDQVASLEADKLSLQELLSKSKDECHRINEMYATRQSAILEENERLKSQHAELTSRLQDQDEFMKQVLKEKLLLEMELKDMLNKSNQTHLRLDRSIDVSYTEDQMLTALDSLNADSRFSAENRILDDDSFMNTLRDDQGRATNMSLFDEIRMSFNMSRLNVTEFNTAHCEKCLDISTIATQTEEFKLCDDCDKSDNSIKILTVAIATQTKFKPYVDHDKVDNNLVKGTAMQTDESEIRSCVVCDKDEKRLKTSVETQTDEIEPQTPENKVEKAVMIDFQAQTNIQTRITEDELKKSDLGIQTDGFNEIELYSGGDNAQNQICLNVNRKLNFDTSIEDIPYETDNNVQFNLNVTKIDIDIQTEPMENEPCLTENIAQFLDAKDYTTTATQTVGVFIRKRPKFVKIAQKILKLKDRYRTAQTQTDQIEPCPNNNNAHCTKCLECNTDYTVQLERDVQYSKMVMKGLEAKISEYESNLTFLEALIDQGKERNEKQKAMVENLLSKIEILENSCEVQRDIINKITSTDCCCVQSQTEFDVTSVSTQADAPCHECLKHKAVAHRGIRRFFWEPLKCLFQMFAVLCFVGAISLLYGVSQRGRVRCDREGGVTPWRWFDAQDIMDLLLRIEYTAEVPM